MNCSGDKSENLKTPKGPCQKEPYICLWVSHLVTQSTSHSKYMNISPHAFTSREEKEPFWNMPAHSVLNKAYTQ
jgi:hypothetical protein